MCVCVCARVLCVADVAAAPAAAALFHKAQQLSHTYDTTVRRCRAVYELNYDYTKTTREKTDGEKLVAAGRSDNPHFVCAALVFKHAFLLRLCTF